MAKIECKEIYFFILKYFHESHKVEFLEKSLYSILVSCLRILIICHFFQGDGDGNIKRMHIIKFLLGIYKTFKEKSKCIHM